MFSFHVYCPDKDHVSYICLSFFIFSSNMIGGKIYRSDKTFYVTNVAALWFTQCRCYLDCLSAFIYLHPWHIVAMRWRSWKRHTQVELAWLRNTHPELRGSVSLLSYKGRRSNGKKRKINIRMTELGHDMYDCINYTRNVKKCGCFTRSSLRENLLFYSWKSCKNRHRFEFEEKRIHREDRIGSMIILVLFNSPVISCQLSYRFRHL